MTIRVTRVLQYEYPDVDTMLQDQQRWTLQSVPGSPVKMRQLGYLMDMDRQPLDPLKMRGIHPEPEWQGYEPTAVIVDELTSSVVALIDGECDVRTCLEWEQEFDFQIIDPDGWRSAGVNYDPHERMTANRFIGLAQNSTLSHVGNWANAKARIV